MRSYVNQQTQIKRKCEEFQVISKTGQFYRKACSVLSNHGLCFFRLNCLPIAPWSILMGGVVIQGQTGKSFSHWDHTASKPGDMMPYFSSYYANQCHRRGLFSVISFTFLWPPKANMVKVGSTLKRGTNKSVRHWAPPFSLYSLATMTWGTFCSTHSHNAMFPCHHVLKWWGSQGLKPP